MNHIVGRPHLKITDDSALAGCEAQLVGLLGKRLEYVEAWEYGLKLTFEGGLSIEANGHTYEECRLSVDIVDRRVIPKGVFTSGTVKNPKRVMFSDRGDMYAFPSLDYRIYKPGRHD